MKQLDNSPDSPVLALDRRKRTLVHQKSTTGFEPFATLNRLVSFLQSVPFIGSKAANSANVQSRKWSYYDLPGP
jgi:hypothetical protein